MADLASVRSLAAELISVHLGGERLNADERRLVPWSFDFDRAKRRAGLCNFTERRITVSRYLAEKYPLDEVHQILLHEIAHALVGPNAGHGPKWRDTARAIGYVGGRTHDGEIAHEQAPWMGMCPAGHEFFRFRKPTRPSSCTKCARGYSPEHGITWRKRVQ
ncbi:SprT-like domain-containing protein [Leucobacter sp. 1207-22]|uniref:SprT-like domain-containing protein n=1 Tax=Leucobacter sp. 1207-22 TaxID=2604456 RepID=UPI004063B812